MEKIVYIVENAAHGKRIDQALSTYCTGYSRNFFQQLIRTNGVCLNGAPLKKSSISVKTGDLIEVTMQPVKRLGALPLPAEDMGVSGTTVPGRNGAAFGRRPRRAAIQPP